MATENQRECLAVADPIASSPMTDVDAQDRVGPPLTGDETSTLLGYLERQRATVGASSITLGGLLKHLTFVDSSAKRTARCHGVSSRATDRPDRKSSPPG
jgi:hypothetical protein